jgi:hypothetical protein
MRPSLPRYYSYCVNRARFFAESVLSAKLLALFDACGNPKYCNHTPKRSVSRMRYHARSAGYCYRDRLSLIGNSSILKNCG